MFQPTPAIIRFTSERVFVFIRFMLLSNDGEISSAVVFIIITIKRHGCGGRGFSVMWVCTQKPPPSQPHLLIVIIIINTTDEEISPS